MPRSKYHKSGLLVVAVALLIVIFVQSGNWRKTVNPEQQKYPIRFLLPETRTSLELSTDPLARNTEPAEITDEIEETKDNPQPRNSTHSPTGANNSIATLSSALMPLDYDLNRAGDSKGVLQIEKPLVVNGKPGRRLEIKIAEGGNILVSKAAFLKLAKEENIGMRNTMALPNVEHVSFSQIRDAGLEVSYDPITDSISLRSGD